MDHDSLNWFIRLAIAGAIFIGLFTIFDSVPFLIRAIGNIFVFGALLFLFDISTEPLFRKLYLTVLSIWVLILVHSGLAFIEMPEDVIKVFRSFTFLIYALSFISLPLFTLSISKYLKQTNSTSSRSWLLLTMLLSAFYLVPTVAFLGTFVLQRTGMTVQLNMGLGNLNLIMDVNPFASIIRALFLLPPIAILIGIHLLNISSKDNMVAV